MRPTVVNLYRTASRPDDVNIMRPVGYTPHCWRCRFCKDFETHGHCKEGLELLRFGNPFSLGKFGDRDVVLAYYGNWLRIRLQRDDVFRKDVWTLWGKRLVCCCVPERCHGTTLAQACFILRTPDGWKQQTLGDWTSRDVKEDEWPTT